MKKKELSEYTDQELYDMIDVLDEKSQKKGISKEQFKCVYKEWCKLIDELNKRKLL